MFGKDHNALIKDFPARMKWFDKARQVHRCQVQIQSMLPVSLPMLLPAPLPMLLCHCPCCCLCRCPCCSVYLINQMLAHQ